MNKYTRLLMIAAAPVAVTVPEAAVGDSDSRMTALAFPRIGVAPQPLADAGGHDRLVPFRPDATVAQAA